MSTPLLKQLETYGLRCWGKYKEPFQFNVIVNDMKDVMAHLPPLRYIDDGAYIGCSLVDATLAIKI